MWHSWEMRDKIVTAMQGTLKMEAECCCKILLPISYNKVHGVTSWVCNQNLRYPLSVIFCMASLISTYAVAWSEPQFEVRLQNGMLTCTYLSISVTYCRIGACSECCFYWSKWSESMVLPTMVAWAHPSAPYAVPSSYFWWCYLCITHTLCQSYQQQLWYAFGGKGGWREFSHYLEEHQWSAVLLCLGILWAVNQ